MQKESPAVYLACYVTGGEAADRLCSLSPKLSKYLLKVLRQEWRINREEDVPAWQAQRERGESIIEKLQWVWRRQTRRSESAGETRWNMSKAAISYWWQKMKSECCKARLNKDEVTQTRRSRGCEDYVYVSDWSLNSMRSVILLRARMALNCS